MSITITHAASRHWKRKTSILSTAHAIAQWMGYIDFVGSFAILWHCVQVVYTRLRRSSVFHVKVTTLQLLAQGQLVEQHEAANSRQQRDVVHDHKASHTVTSFSCMKLKLWHTLFMTTLQGALRNIVCTCILLCCMGPLYWNRTATDSYFRRPLSDSRCRSEYCPPGQYSLVNIAPQDSIH